MHRLSSSFTSATFLVAVVSYFIALLMLIESTTAATLSSVSKNSVQERRSRPAANNGGGAFYSRPENYPSPTSALRRRPTTSSTGKTQNRQIPELSDPVTLAAAFRPDTFNGRSPFLTFNGRGKTIVNVIDLEGSLLERNTIDYRCECGRTKH